MKLSYKRDMTHNYMVPDLTETLNEDDYRVHMLLENQIPGLLPCSIKKINCQSRFFYEITSRQSMERIYGRWLMSEEDILTFLRGFYRTLKEIRKYLLDADMLVLTPQTVYLDVETRMPEFCYLPGYRKSITESFQEITKYILEHLDRREEGAVLLAYEIYRKAKEENDCLEEILKEALARDMQKWGNEKEWNIQRDSLKDRTADYEVFRNRRLEYQEDEKRRPEYGGERELKWRPEYGGDRELKRRPEYGGDREPKQQLRERREYEETYRRSAPAWDEADDMDWDEEPPAKEKKPKKEKKKAKRKTGKKEKSGQTFLCICFFFAIMLAAAAAWLWGLSTAQIGGIVFLLAGILVYGCSVGKKQKNEKSKKKKGGESNEWKEAGYQDDGFEPEYEEIYQRKTDARRRENTDFYGQSRISEYETADRVSENRPVYGRRKEAAKERLKPEKERETRSKKRERLGDTGVLYEENAYEPTLLLVSANPNSREAILLDQDCYLVGKLAAEADIVLKHPSVSRLHAKIERRGRDYYLCDLNSTNGTFLNGQRLEINESVPLHPQDEIAFAKVRYHVGQC